MLPGAEIVVPAGVAGLRFGRLRFGLRSSPREGFRGGLCFTPESMALEVPAWGFITFIEGCVEWGLGLRGFS